MKHKTFTMMLAVLMSMTASVVCAEEHEYVDLGLPSGTLWATCNVGANSPEEYGDYFAWGETSPKTVFDWSNYKWCNGSENSLTKYNYSSSYGTVDNKMELDIEDDAAYVNWGSDWLMPTMDQRDELCGKCSWVLTKFNNVNGYLVTGPNGKSIFFPQAGWGNGEIVGMGEYGNYATRALDSSDPTKARAWSLKTNMYTSHNWRCLGRSIRPGRNIKENVAIVEGNTYMNNETKDIDEICYTRTFSNTEWQALYVPFEMTYADWQADFEMARLNDVHQWDDDDDGTIDRTELEAVKMKSGKTEANTPYLIRAKSTGEKTITLTNTTLYKAEENSFDVSSWNTKFTFTGTYSGVSGTDMFTNGYYAMGGGRLHQAESSAYDLSPMRWYMKVTDRNGIPKSLGEVKVMLFDTTDGISPTENAEKTENTEVYDLSGRRTDKPTKKGIYIRNGRKMIVR